MAGMDILFKVTNLKKELAEIAKKYDTLPADYFSDARSVYLLCKALYQTDTESALMFYFVTLAVCTYANYNGKVMWYVGNGKVLDRSAVQGLLLQSVVERNSAIATSASNDHIILSVINMCRELYDKGDVSLASCVSLQVVSIFIGLNRGPAPSSSSSSSSSASSSSSSASSSSSSSSSSSLPSLDSSGLHILRKQVNALDLSDDKPLVSLSKRVAPSLKEHRLQNLDAAIAQVKDMEMVEERRTEVLACLNAYKTSLNDEVMEKEVLSALRGIGLNHSVVHLLSVVVGNGREIFFPSPLLDSLLEFQKRVNAR